MSALAAKGITLPDIGTSGGVWGLTNGFSMMVGGDENAYNELMPALDTLAQYTVDIDSLG